MHGMASRSLLPNAQDVYWVPWSLLSRIRLNTDYAEVGVKPENLRMAWSWSPADGFPGLTSGVTVDMTNTVTTAGTGIPAALAPQPA